MTLTSCGGADTPPSFALNVFLRGLSGSGLQVTLNGGAPISISLNSQTTLARLSDGASYTVAIISQPSSPLQICTATNPAGTVAGNTDVMIACALAVPDVIGLTEAAASTSLTPGGLVVGVVSTATSKTIPAGLVISETPDAGSGTSAGSSVDLLVSAGPPTIAVPNLVGLNQAAAAGSLTTNGLELGNTTAQSSLTVPQGIVIGETPPAGNTVVVGSAVSLIVSSGIPLVVVPNVVGSTQAAATTALGGSGLALGAVTTQSSSSVASGVVLSESPNAGTSVAAGSAVSLVVSSGAGNAKAAAAMASMTLATAAITKGEALWATLAHTDLAGDLVTLAQQLISSGVVTGAVASDNGVFGSLSDGTQVVLFLDDVNPVPVAPSSTVTRVAPAQNSLIDEAPQNLDDKNDPVLQGSTSHEIAFLVNVLDGANFTTPHQLAWANAFYAAGFPRSSYESDALYISLDNIVALGNTHPLDYLNIATHGSGYCLNGECEYTWRTSQFIGENSFVQYFDDIQAGLAGAAGLLSIPNTLAAADHEIGDGFITYWFDPGFLTKYAVFNPGAVVANDSCDGQRPQVGAMIAAKLAAVNVGLYAGWATKVSGWDADQSTTYLLDRILGEQNPSVTQLGSLNFSIVDPIDNSKVFFQSSLPLIDQKTPPQRPFPLQDVISAMATVNRLPAPNTSAARTLVAGGLTFTVLNGGAANSDLAIWGLPSISTLQVAESPTGGMLTIQGNFSKAAGTVSIIDVSGIYPLTLTSWSTTSITASLPPGGNGSSGTIQVVDANGIASNAVPLTAWAGTLQWQESDQFSIANGAVGNGSGSIDATLKLLFRADVHPVVQSVDAPAVPQNFAFSGLMGTSSVTLTGFNAVITDASGNTATYLPMDPPSTAYGGYALPLSEGQFNVVGNLPIYLPPSCNNGQPGPQSGPTTVFCPLVDMYPQNPGTCTGALCTQGDLSFGAVFGWLINSQVGTFGTLTLTMDPTTYALSVATTPASITQGYRFGNPATLQITLTGSIDSPTSTPEPATPAGTRKRAAATLRAR